MTKKLFWSLLILSLPLCGLAQFTVTTNNGTVTITGYTGAGGNVDIPESINGYPVTSIGRAAFFSCNPLTGVTIPDTVTTIEAFAFSTCFSLTNVFIPNSVTNIEDSAFYTCPVLSSVTIPGGVPRIGILAFSCCIGLTSVSIGAGVTDIDYGAFSGCSSLASVTLPDSVTTVGPIAFGNCSGLTNVTIGKSVTNMGANAFSLCPGLTSVTIPGSLASISNAMFYGCSSLTNVTILKGVANLGNDVFSGCSSLATVTIPDSVTSLGSGVFNGCSGLTTVTIPASVTNLGSSVFSGCSSLHRAYFLGDAPLINGSYGSYDKSFFSGATGTVYYKSGSTGWYYIYGGWLAVEITRPSLTIRQPVAGQKWSNNVCTFAGKVSNNVPVIAVYYSLNDDNWHPATTTDHWTNWSAAVALVAGTNRFKAYAVNTVLDCSMTNSIAVNYVQTLNLGLDVVGGGHIKGATNGQPEIVGSTLKLTASPDKGYVLTNWLVRVSGITVLSTNKAVPFVMQSNLDLTATFADVRRPVLRVVSPKNGSRTTNSLVLISGRVTDNGPDGTVFWQLNNDGWNAASGWMTWSNVVPLSSRTNFLQVYAQDSGGNRSRTNLLKIICTALPVNPMTRHGKIVTIQTQKPEFLGGPELVGGTFHFVFAGDPDRKVVVEGSANLKDWTPLQTNQSAGGEYDFSALQTNNGARFYRLRSE